MIDYNGGDIFLQEAVVKDLLITDGTVTVDGTDYTVTGATVTITNDLLEQEAFELKQSLNSGNQINFGSCEAAQISFVIHDNIPTVKGKVLKVYLIPNHDASKMLQIGVYKVDEDKLSADRTKRTITAFDAMYDILNADVADWYNTELPNGNSSKTLLQFRTDFLSHFGITAESASLVNDTITIKRTIAPESLSGGDVIKAICEINGVFGTITNEGNFRFVTLAADINEGLFPEDDLYPDDDLYPAGIPITLIEKSQYTDITFEDYMSEAITQLSIRTDDSDVGVTVGTSGNQYIITGNFLVYGYTSSNLTGVANRILPKIVSRYYRPCTINCIGNPLYEVGDAVRVATKYRGIVTYIFERTLRGIQALRDTYSAQGEQYFGEQLNSVTSQFKQLSGKVASLKVESDGIESRVEDIENGTASVITQLDDEIDLKVSKSNIVSDLNDEMSGIAITSNSIAIQSSGTFSVDSSNFRLASSGSLTIRNVTFDYTGSGHANMTINNGVISSGNMSLSYNQLSFGAGDTNIGSTYVNVPSNGSVSIGATTLTSGNSNELLVNGSPVLTGGSSSYISVGEITMSVGLYINSNTALTENYFMFDGHVLGFKNVKDTNGNTVHVLGY